MSDYIIKKMFKNGDMVKGNTKNNSHIIGEISGFRFCTLYRGEDVGLEYQVTNEQGKTIHWGKESDLEFYTPKKPKTIPATEDELNRMSNIIWIKSKISHSIYPIGRQKVAKDFWLFNPETKCWEDWSENEHS